MFARRSAYLPATLVVRTLTPALQKHRSAFFRHFRRESMNTSTRDLTDSDDTASRDDPDTVPGASARRRRNLHSTDFSFDSHYDANRGRAEQLRADATAASPMLGRRLADASRVMWEHFYRRHAGSFFKPRYFILEAFPELRECLCIFEVGVGNGSNVAPILDETRVARLLACDIATGALSTLQAHSSDPRVVPFLWDAVLGTIPDDAAPIDALLAGGDSSKRNSVSRPLPPSPACVVAETLAHSLHSASAAHLDAPVASGMRSPSLGMCASDDAIVPEPSASCPSQVVPPPPQLPLTILRLLSKTRGAAEVKAPEESTSWLRRPPELSESGIDAAVLMFVLSAIHPNDHAAAIRNIAGVSELETAIHCWCV
jgi:hypothetical protein